MRCRGVGAGEHEHEWMEERTAIVHGLTLFLPLYLPPNTDLGHHNPAAASTNDSLSPTLAQLQAAAAVATARARSESRDPDSPPAQPRPNDTMEITWVSGLFSDAGPTEVRCIMLPPPSSPDVGVHVDAGKEEGQGDGEGMQRRCRNRVETLDEQELQRSLNGHGRKRQHQHQHQQPSLHMNGGSRNGGLSSSLRKLAGSLLKRQGSNNGLRPREQGEGEQEPALVGQRRPPRALPQRWASL